MEKICKSCWNESCKAQSDDFRRGKLPVCVHMQEHPEEWAESERVEESNEEL